VQIGNNDSADSAACRPAHNYCNSSCRLLRQNSAAPRHAVRPSVRLIPSRLIHWRGRPADRALFSRVYKQSPENADDDGPAGASGQGSIRLSVAGGQVAAMRRWRFDVGWGCCVACIGRVDASGREMVGVEPGELDWSGLGGRWQCVLEGQRNGRSPDGRHWHTCGRPSVCHSPLRRTLDACVQFILLLYRTRRCFSLSLNIGLISSLAEDHQRPIFERIFQNYEFAHGNCAELKRHCQREQV